MFSKELKKSRPKTRERTNFGTKKRPQLGPRNIISGVSDPRSRNHKSPAVGNRNIKIASSSRRNRSEIKVFSESQCFLSCDCSR